MPTGPSQSNLPASATGIIDGEFIAFEDETVTTDVQSAYIDIGEALFRGSLFVEITSSSDTLGLKIQSADDTAGTNPAELDQLFISSGVTGRFRLDFTNTSKAGDGSLKSAIRVELNTGVAGPVVVKIAYITKAQNDPGR